MSAKRLLALALLAAIGAAAMLVRPSPRPPAAPAPVCGDSTSCGTDAPLPAAPTALPAAPPPGRTATRTVEPSVAATPVDGAALRAEADRLIAAGQVIEGIDVFRKAVEAAPTAKNHGDLGGLLYKLTAFDEAATHLRAAAELDSGNADRWIALANVYYRKVDPGEAWKAEKRARTAEPGLALGRDAEGMRVRKQP